MSRRRRHRTDSAGFRARHSERPGVIRRVTRGLADKFGLPRTLVLVGFVIGLIMNAPLTIVLFLVALYWVDHPGRLERKLNRLTTAVRKLWPDSNSWARRQTFSDLSTDEPAAIDPELEFIELRRQFQDLERRAGHAEAHVASDEFQLNRDMGRM